MYVHVRWQGQMMKQSPKRSSAASMLESDGKMTSWDAHWDTGGINAGKS